MDLIKIAEEAFATKKEFPAFRSGDTITVAYRIKEGNKERIQQYRGVVIRISGHGDKKRFTVRKMSENVGVERIFPIESPFIEECNYSLILLPYKKPSEFYSGGFFVLYHIGQTESTRDKKRQPQKDGTVFFKTIYYKPIILKDRSYR